MSRSAALEDLLNLNAPLKEVQVALSAFPWDSNKDLAALRPSHLAGALTKYLNGELNEKEIEDWANSIECREDIAAEAAVTRHCLHELANPLLEQPLTQVRAQWWISQLK